MHEKMVPYVMKMPPTLLSRIKTAATTVRSSTPRRKSGITPAAFIRRAIERDLKQSVRSRNRSR